MNLSQKRLLHDCKEITKNPLHSSGIYHEWDADNIYHVRALIFGPDETPYQHGAYFFDVTFTDKFPFAPPKVKFMTLDGLVRFNPNLYVCGKVCLSILGTWSGPGWTSVQNISSILLSIQTLLNYHPIQNEPGFETVTGKKSKDYNNMLEHANIRLATLAMIKNPPPGFECFKEVLVKNFFQHYDSFLQTCQVNTKKPWDNMTVKAPIYSWNEKYRYTLQSKKLTQLYQELQTHYPAIYTAVNKDTVTTEAKNEVVSHLKDQQKTTKKIHRTKRKAPTLPAKQFEVGYTMISDNSTDKYLVALNKNMVKRWQKIPSTLTVKVV